MWKPKPTSTSSSHPPAAHTPQYKARELSMPIPHPRLDQHTHQHPSHPFALILTWSMRVVFTLSVGGVTVGDGDGGGDSIMSNLQGGQEL